MPSTLVREVVASGTVTRLRVALARSSRLLRATPTAQQLTPTQLQLLGALVRAGEMPMADLAKHEGLNPTMLSRSIGNLEALGLVARSAGESDKRSVTARITEQGQDLHSQARAEADARLAEHLAALDPVDVEALVKALPALEHLATLLKGERA